MVAPPAPVAVSAEGLTVHYGAENIFENASLTIHDGDRKGLVGINGCGKSTFMKILAEQEQPGDGKVIKRKKLRTGFLPQEFQLNEKRSVYENTLEAASFLTGLLREYEKVPHNTGKAEILEREITRLDAWDINRRIEYILTKLKCPHRDKKVSRLSGGEKRRTALAGALVAEPELLLLDEPTNHLDTESIAWLEEFIRSYKGACIFVTHDRYFLNNVSTEIVELRNGQFKTYPGNYSQYLRKKTEDVNSEEIREEKRKKFLRKELEWTRRGPKARTTKAQYRVNRFNELSSVRDSTPETEVELIIPPPERLGNKAVSLENISISYENQAVIKDFSMEIPPGSKIGVIGPNGSGKTTLIKTVLGLIKPDKGKVSVSENIIFNYIDQERSGLTPGKTVIEEIGEGGQHIMLGSEKISIWGYLKRFLFDDERMNIKTERLSGGERARLLLALNIKKGGNFLILDEPTNDLDLGTLRILEEAIAGFPGCVMLVSHDRYFINRICDSIIAFEKDGNICLHTGDYDYYIEKRRKYFFGHAEKRKKQRPPAPASPLKPKIRKLKWKEEKELENIEGKITEAELRIEKLHALFSTSNFFKNPPEKVRKTRQDLQEAEKYKDSLYERWDKLESIKNGEVTE